MMCFNYLQSMGAFSRDEKGIYTVNYDLAPIAINSWASTILSVQGEGNYDFAVKFRSENGFIKTELQQDLDRINAAGIPRDIRFNQGLKTLGL